MGDTPALSADGQKVIVNGKEYISFDVEAPARPEASPPE